MKKLINAYGLHTTPTYTTGKTLYELNGKIRKTKRSLPLSPLGILDLYNLKRKIKNLIKQLSEDAPLTSPLAHELDKQTVDQYISTNLFTQEGRAYYRMIVEEILCSKAHEVSTLDLLWCIKSTGSVNYLLQAEHEWIIEGARTLAERIADSLGQGICYEAPVEQISYQEKLLYVYTPQQYWRAKKVIIAIPPNLTTRIKFVPPLPAGRVQLSERSGIPSVIKMVIVYKQPFWRREGLSGKVFSNQVPAIFITDSSPPNESKGILTAITTGESARKIVKLQATARKQETIRTLVKFFGHKASEPLSFYEKIWSEDEWTQGGYGTHYAPGVLTHYGAALFEPVSSLYGAGAEATTEWRTYMEGAVQSGQKAAMEVINSLKNRRPPNRPSI